VSLGENGEGLERSYLQRDRCEEQNNPLLNPSPRLANSLRS
jgi:hypothetical protein